MMVMNQRLDPARVTGFVFRSKKKSGRRQELFCLGHCLRAGCWRLRSAMSLVYTAGEDVHYFCPLTTLRDNLIITIQDAEGNEISHTGSQESSVRSGLVSNEASQVSVPLDNPKDPKFDINRDRNSIQKQKSTVVKVVIMVGFATLVFLTGKRTYR
ncbi:hypothetical protein V6N13_095171 [Hibiscus sabdariffa]